MKLNYRFILITSVIVVIVSVVSTFLFYSLAGKVLSQQQAKSILYSTNDFAFMLQSELSNVDEEFRSLMPTADKFSKIKIDSTSIDFCFTLIKDSLINFKEYKLKTNSFLNIRATSFRQFLADNPNIILRYAQYPNMKTVYYGIQVSNRLLDKLAEKTRAQIALVINDSPVEISNSDKNQGNLLELIKASRELKYKNNYDIYSAELDNADFIASLYTPKNILTPAAKISFIVFESFKEGMEFRSTLRIVMLLIVIAGSAVTFIVVWVSTAKVRKQFSLLSEIAETSKKGNLDNRVPILTKDEVGKFSETFNKMLDELVRNKKAEKDYSEFITLINRNPTLAEISDATLSKIIKSTGLTFGVLYLVENKSLRLISSFGISKKFIELTQDVNLYSNAIEKKEKVEFKFHENFPEIKTGITAIKIKYLIIYPIVYNKETIALLELASESFPQSDVLDYIENIHEQLAVGLINAKSFEQLENFVNELTKLNDEYQKQNEQIVKQNDELRKLHKELKEKAEELEFQRSKAVELTKVKSEFLASMSHELRTPLISILGLTELLIKDYSVSTKVKDRLNIVYRNGKKLLSLITNILEFSKFESGKIEVKKESFMLFDLLEEVYSNIKNLADQKDLNLVFNLRKNEDILINSDKTKLEQILLNLLYNAIKFTEKGSVQLSFKLIGKSDIEFCVSDTGIGISEEEKLDIFNEFKQVDNGSSRKYDGAGLGLAICQKYIELLGGKLTLQSELGAGSHFKFILPSAVLDIIENQSHKFLTMTQSETTKTKSVLLINDNSDTQKFIGDYLASYKFKTIILENADEAIILAKEKIPEAIIINPFVDQHKIWHLITELKSSEATKEIPIIFTIFIQEAKVGWEPNIFEFLISPITTNDFKNIILNLESYSGKKVSNVLMIAPDNSEFNLIKNSLQTGVNMHLITSLENSTDAIQKVKPELIIIDMYSFKESAFHFIYKISENRETKNVPVIIKMQKELAENDIDVINRALKEITLKVKSHPLDILKVLRDRLKIDDEEANKKLILAEESIKQEELKFAIDKTEKDLNDRPTVMIVDDDEDALFTIGEFIKEMNCNTIYAHNGMECLLTLNHIEPDLIFLDIMMPQMDGFETIRRIKSESRFEKIPVVALTAYAMLDNKEVIERNGFNDLITKPIDSQLLASKLSYFLKTKINQI